MPVIGERRKARGDGYKHNPEAAYAKACMEAVESVQNESAVDLASQVGRAYALDDVNDNLRNFFLEGAVFEKDNSQYPFMEDVEDAYKMLEEQYENDVEAIREYANIGGMNPVIGMTPFIHKNLLLNCIFDKGVLQKFVARSPKFTFSMETRIMRNAVGDEIDMWLEQNKIFDMMESTAPFKDTIITLPEVGNTDILAATFGANALDDNLSIETNISAVLLTCYAKAGETVWDATNGVEKVQAADGTADKWFQIAPKFFKPAYGEYDRTIMDSFATTIRKDATSTELVQGTFMGWTKKNRFNITCSNAAVKAIKLTSRIDTSTAMLRTCTVDWKVRTDIVEIPNAIPINTPISPEEVKDLAALYNVNQLAKIMSMFKIVLSNYKDEKVHRFLDKSFINLPEANKFAGTFNFAPRQGYFSDHIDWRQAVFMDALETFVTPMLQVLRDPNMTISVIGRPDIIRKITPNENVSFTSPDSSASIQMEFKKTVVTNDKRVYNFMSTDKMLDNNNLIIILNPRNSERCIYRLYDYQMFVSNEIRNAANWALPAIHAFERFKCVEYQPVQGRLRILNPTGLLNYEENQDPLGTNRMNTYTANLPEAVRENYVAPNDSERATLVNPNSFIY